jgi:hypothetical protein
MTKKWVKDETKRKIISIFTSNTLTKILNQKSLKIKMNSICNIGKNGISRKLIRNYFFKNSMYWISNKVSFNSLNL